MTNFVILGLNIELGDMKRIKVSDFNFNSVIRELKDKASQESETPPDTLELMHQGRLLDEQKTLKDYSVKSGDVIYVIKKHTDKISDTKLPETSLKSLYNIHSMVLSRGIRPGSLTSFINSLESVFNPQNIDRFIEIYPELSKDPVAVSFLTAPELLFHLQDQETFNNVNKDHPVLVPAFVKIYKTLFNVGGSSQNASSHSQMAESEEEYEDVDLMDPDEYDDDSDNQGGNQLITSEQLAAALAMARASTSNNTNSNNSGNNSASGPSSSSSQLDTGLRDFLGSLLSGVDSETPSNSGTPSRPVITRDMISNALSQALSTVSNTSTSNSNLSNYGEPSGMMPTFTPSDSPTYVPTPVESNYSEQLTTMREMGLMNHRVNLRALMVSNGDVNSAINLVLSGAIDD